MKHVLIILFSLLTYGAVAQKIAKKEIDEFTKVKKVETSWEVMYRTMGCGCQSFFMFNKSNDVIYFNFKYAERNTPLISEGSYFMLKLSNDSIVKFIAKETAVPCRGCGSIGFMGSEMFGTNSYYFVNPEYYELLKNNLIAKFRFKTMDGFIEYELNEKRAKAFQESFNLILNE
jgi:hypothetical protein